MIKTRMTTKIAALVSTLGLALGATALAAPANAELYYGATMRVFNVSSDRTYNIGLSTLNGHTFPQGTGYDTTVTSWPHPNSLRAVKTGRGWCIYENSYYQTSVGWTQLVGMSKVHRYTTANGGYSQLAVATFSQTYGGKQNTSTDLKLYRC